MPMAVPKHLDKPLLDVIISDPSIKRHIPLKCHLLLAKCLDEITLNLVDKLDMADLPIFGVLFSFVSIKFRLVNLHPSYKLALHSNSLVQFKPRVYTAFFANFSTKPI